MTDTALIYFNPFAGEDTFSDFNSLPAESLCLSILAQGFSGIEHVKVLGLSAPRPLAECP